MDVTTKEEAVEWLRDIGLSVTCTVTHLINYNRLQLNENCVNWA